jgi:myo-inositol-1(or 4)-monophosphatase
MHLFPMFCVSIGFIVDGKAVIGVIHAPFLNQLFSSCIGRGAWLNESQRLPLTRNPIPPMPVNAPSGCIFSCEWGKDRRDQPDSNLHRKVESFFNMAAEIGGRGGKGGMVHGVRSLGSATLDLAYAAMGAFDIWWYVNHPFCQLPAEPETQGRWMLGVGCSSRHSDITRSRWPHHDSKPTF